MADSSVAPKQMQVRVTFYTIHNPQSILMILKNDCALEQIAEKARQLFPSANYRLFYGDVNGPIYEFTDSEQIMAKIRITSFSRTPQLFVRLEPSSSTMVIQAPKKTKEREPKNSMTLKRIEMNQEQTMKTINQLQKDFERVTRLEEAIADLQKKGEASQPSEPKKRNIKQAKHSATCDACLGDIIGHRYKCLECPDFDLCESCEKNSVHFEHAMLRLVCPRKSTIPSYVTDNAPSNVFPSYMKTHVVHLEMPFPTIPVPAPAAPAPAVPAPADDLTAAPEQPNASDAKFREDTRAALKNSAAMIKSTFHTLSKSFLDLADGAQTGMDKKIFERSKMEAGMASFEDTLEYLTRQCEEKYFGAPQENIEKTQEDAQKNVSAQEFFEKHNDSSKVFPAKREQKTCFKKNVYKKAGSKISSSFLASLDKEEAKRRTDASTAELQRKLEELNTKETKVEEQPRQQPVLERPEGLFGLDPAFYRYHSIFARNPTPSSLSSLAAAACLSQTCAPATPVYPSLFEEAIAVPVAASAPKEEKKDDSPMMSLARQTSPMSIHSSFEHIPSDYESISPIWGSSPNELIGSIAPEAVEVNVAPTAPQIPIVAEMEVFENSDDDMEFYDGEESVEEQPTQEQPVAPVEPQPTVEAEPLLSVVDAQTERTFDRLLEMGFDYNVVVAAIKMNGSDLQKCLQSIIQ